MFLHDTTVPRLVLVFDIRSLSQFNAGLSMLQTLFLCVVLALGNLLFSRDANRLVLQPIDRMVRKMQRIRDDPLSATTMGLIEHRREQIAAKLMTKRHLRLARAGGCYRFLRWLLMSRKATSQPMETVMLEATIIKLGTLLAVGFGEAGTKIVAKNLQAQGSGVNAMVPGCFVDAIFGFFLIREFDSATEILQKKIMLFVNQIGRIVHSVVDEYSGATNRNLGEAFLTVWSLSQRPDHEHRRLAELALMSVVQVTAKINTSMELAEYRAHPRFAARSPGFRVRVHVGLHTGWAIEGAIGSPSKIDASYLSNSVNTAARLQAASRQYKLHSLMSGEFVDLLGEDVQDHLRLVDSVIVVGSSVATGVYTMDLDVGVLKVDELPERVSHNRIKRLEVTAQRKAAKWSPDYSFVHALTTDPALVAMRKRYSDRFFSLYDMGYRNYQAGEWEVAKYYFEQTLDMLEGATPGATERDGPSEALLSFMKNRDFKPGDKWGGARSLTSK
mmetsp:Transcript_31162/g.66045  ORF Transcript_31162/g.66045 Transcript_31162/m.66045 type:complete len:501 (+) Transcript_31162:3-1505(+)